MSEWYDAFTTNTTNITPQQYSVQVKIQEQAQYFTKEDVMKLMYYSIGAYVTDLPTLPLPQNDHEWIEHIKHKKLVCAEVA